MTFDITQYLSDDRGASGIAQAFEKAIETGAIAADAKLPSIRALAGQLGVNPTTAAAAYRTLSTRGLVHGDSRRGTRVVRDPSPSSPATFGNGLRDLASGNPDPALLPDLRAALRSAPVQPVLYGSAPKSERLVAFTRESLTCDGIDARHIAVAAGAIDGIERVLAAYLRSGDRVALEDPCFSRLIGLARSRSLLIEPFRVDDRGPVPESLRHALQRGVKAVIVTPRAQNPYGAALDEERAQQLRAALSGHPDVLLIEDDHAGLINEQATITLTHGWPGPWAVLRSFAKALGPDLRLAVIAGDERTIARVDRQLMVATGWISHIIQDVAMWLMLEQSTADVLRKATTVYSARRNALLGELSARGIPAHGASGLNVWVPVPREDTTVHQLAAQGWAVLAGESFRSRTEPAIRVTTASLDTDDAAPFADALREALTPAHDSTQFA